MSLDLTGEQLRDAGIERVTQNSQNWQAHARQVIAELAATGKPFTVDDFHERLEFYPHHSNAIGAAFRKARKDGLIVRVQPFMSKRPAAHARLTWLYQGMSDAEKKPGGVGAR